jgi:hypothetical protein
VGLHEITSRDELLNLPLKKGNYIGSGKSESTDADCPDLRGSFCPIKGHVKRKLVNLTASTLPLD